jgi:hypothetical protein
MVNESPTLSLHSMVTPVGIVLSDSKKGEALADSPEAQF